MIGRELIESAFLGNCNVCTLDHLRYLSDKREVPFQDVRVAARDLEVCVKKLNGSTYVGRKGFDVQLKAFAEHHQSALSALVESSNESKVYEMPFDDPIPEM